MSLRRHIFIQTATTLKIRNLKRGFRYSESYRTFWRDWQTALRQFENKNNNETDERLRVKRMAMEHATLESILGLIQERNLRETSPFIAIHDRCNLLEQQVEAGHRKCEDLERQISFQPYASSSSAGLPSGPSTTESAALRNERRMREMLERLEQELKTKNVQHEEDVDKIEKSQKELKDLKEVHMAQEKSLIQLQEEIDEKQKALDHVSNIVEDSQQRTKLAEQQYIGLKETIRALQDENDEYQKENRQLEQRLVSEKERLSTEMNALTDTVEKLKKELDLIRSQQQEDAIAANTSINSRTECGVTAATVFF